MKTLLVVSLILCSALTLTARLPAGHYIFRAKDVDVANKFWTTHGGEPSALATIKLMKFPGVLLFISTPIRGELRLKSARDWRQ